MTTLLAAIVLNALWEDALLVLCVWLLLRVWPGINAATRYVVWSAALFAAVLVPVATTYASFVPAASFGAPRGEVSRPRAVDRTTIGMPVDAPALGGAGTASAVRRFPMPRFDVPDRIRLTIPVSAARAVVAVWAMLTAYALLGLLVGLRRLERLKRDALPLPLEYRDAMPQWQRANKGRREVRLCISDEIDVPVAVGLFDSMILIPRDLLERLSPGEVEQISLHELAHLRRGDDWTNCVQRLVVAALGWNPAALFVAQQLELEREVACDDWVLSSVHSVRPYAMCLTKMAQTAAWPHHPMPAPGVFTTRKQISLRIERLLCGGRDIATTLSVGPAAGAVAGVAAAAIVIAMVAPSIAAPSIEPPFTAPPQTAVQSARVTAPTHRSKTLSTIDRRTRIVAVHPAAVAPLVVAPALHGARPAVDAIVGKTVAENLRRVRPMAGAASRTGAAGAEADAESMASSADSIAEAAVDSATGMLNSVVATTAGATARRIATTGRTCVGCNFAGMNWAGKDLRGADYTGVTFNRAILTSTDFSDSKLNGVDFVKANLAGASFRRAHLTGCDFSGANLTNTDFTGAWMSGCQFTGARLRSAELRDVLSACKGCDFTNADLAGVNLAGARLNGDDFSHADLRDVNFANAELVGVDLSRARLDGANFAGATLNGCDLSGVDLRRINLSQATITGMDFSGSQSP